MAFEIGFNSFFLNSKKSNKSAPFIRNAGYKEQGLNRINLDV